METQKEIIKLLREIDESFSPLIKRVEQLETRLRTRKWATLPGMEGNKFSLGRAINAMRTGDWSNAGYEKEVFDNTRRRALGTSDDSAGGYLVPVEAMPDLIEMLRADSVVIGMGARVIDNLSGSPVLFPKQTGGATVYWVGDNVTIPPSEAAFGQLRMTPRKAAALVKISNSLLALSLPSAEDVIRQDIAAQMALAIDLAALRGGGTENEPLGIANTPGISTVVMGDNGATLGGTLDVFEEMVYKLAAANALKGSLGFIFHPVVRKVLRKLKVAQWSGDGAGYPLLPVMLQAALTGDSSISEALNYPFKCTTQIPTDLTKGMGTGLTEVYFANWAELLIGQWAGMSILASNQAGTAFSDDQTWLRIITNIDIGIRHEESFCLVSDLAV